MTTLTYAGVPYWDRIGPLLDATVRAQALGRADMLAVMHPWMPAEMERVQTIFGRDPFAYGVPPNRRTAEAMAGCSFEHGCRSVCSQRKGSSLRKTHDWASERAR